VDQLLTPKQVGQAIGVSESSLKRWCDQGRINTIRTPGGHRRLPLADVLQFLRTQGMAPVEPEILGLPSNTGKSERILTRADDQLFHSLVEGDEELARQIVFELYLASHRPAVILDQVMTPAFHRIGKEWECGDVEVFRERHACQIGLRVLRELRSTLPTAPSDAPIAIGGTPEGDPYDLPTAMIELTLRDVGWNASSLGTRLPFPTLIEAVDRLNPQLLWISVSHIDEAEEFVEEFERFSSDLEKRNTMLVVGGQALNASLRKQMRYAAFCDTLQQLETLALSLN
jgi:MerR family transcriptional regulator, light-induced transcriptional regulator